MFRKIAMFLWHIIWYGIWAAVVTFLSLLIIYILSAFAVPILGLMVGATIESWIAAFIHWDYWFNIVFGLLFISFMLEEYGVLGLKKRWTTFSFDIRFGKNKSDKPDAS